MIRTFSTFSKQGKLVFVVSHVYIISYVTGMNSFRECVHTK